MSGDLPRIADAVVVGGGIVGTAIARQLARDGVDTVLVERGAFGGAVSGASLACLGTHMHSLEELEVLVESCALWRSLSEELGNPFEYNRSGQLRFILREEDIPVAQRWIDGERAYGLDPELLSPEAVREKEPLLTGPIAAASYSPGDATVNPFLAVRALLRDGRDAGLAAFANTAVTGLEMNGDSVADILTDKGKIAASHVILAAGPWSGRLAEHAGLSLPLVPRQAQCVASVRQPPSIRMVVGACESAGGVESGYTQIQQAASGQILFNTVTAPVATQPGAEDRVNEVPLGFVRDSIRMLTTLFPSLSDILMLRSWVRFEAVTPDDRFLAGPLPRQGLIAAAGDNGTGFCRAPVLGRLVSRVVRGEAARPADALYAPSRFTELRA